MEPNVYPDSSFIVTLVSNDNHSAQARACMARLGEPLLFTPLHRIESRNALRNAVAHGVIDPSDCRAAFRQIDNDLREGMLVHAAVDWTGVFRRADELSEKHADANGQRTIDLIHVSIALEAGAKTFLSFDRRQRNLAGAAGLKIKP